MTTEDRSQPVMTQVQRDLVTAPSGRRVFLGGPGAGKSLVLAERAARLIASGVAQPASVLLLAPSRRAAAALGDQAQRRIGGGLAPTATTFHSLALTILRRHYREMGYGRPPELLATARHFHELRTILAGEDPARWAHYNGALRSNALRKLAYDVVMGAAENGLDADEIRRRARLVGRLELEDLAGFAARYWAHGRQAGLLDFGQLLTGVIILLSERPDIAGSYRRAYRHILVDEYEQANYAQAEMLRLLLDGGTDLVIAGDPEQAINSYRGGTPAHILTCARQLDAEVITSAENHRSAVKLRRLCRATRPLVTGMASLGEQETGAERSDTQDDDGDAENGYIALRPFTHPAEEARWVAAEVASLLAAGTPATAIAILFRSLATPIAKLVARELARMGIAHQQPSGAGGPGNALVQSALLALRYLHLSSHPNQRHGTSMKGDGAKDDAERQQSGQTKDAAKTFLDLLDSPLAGLPPFGVAELKRTAASVGRDPGRLEIEGLEGLPVSEEVRAALAALLQRLAELRQKLNWSAASLLWEVWRGFPAFLDDAREGGQASAAYASLLNEIAGLEEGRRFLGLRELTDLLDAGYFQNLGDMAPRGRGVAILTVHAAKGREWDIVFLPGLIEGTFPLGRSPLELGPVLARDLPDDWPEHVAECAVRFEALRQGRHRDEERRVFHVAVSRGRQALYISYSRRGADGTSAELPSRFLERMAACPGVEVVPGDGAERPPSSVDEAVLHYRHRLSSPDPLRRTQALYALDKMRRRWPDAVRPMQWWDNVEETAGASPPFPEGGLRLSASRLGAFRSCPLGYQFGYHWRLGEPEGPPLTIGNVLHAVLEEYHQPGSALPRTRESLELLLERHFDPGAFRYKPIARQAKKALQKMLDSYFGRYGEATAIALEEPFSFAFGSHRISGFIDRIDRLAGGGLELIDYKTGTAMAHDEAKNDLQLALYDLAFYNDESLAAYGRPALASYLYLKNIGARADGKRSYAPSDESRQRLEGLVTYYASSILGERFPAHRDIAAAFPDLDLQELERVTRKDPCRFCSFGWVCPEQQREAGGE